MGFEGLGFIVGGSRVRVGGLPARTWGGGGGARYGWALVPFLEPLKELRLVPFKDVPARESLSMAPCIPLEDLEKGLGVRARVL